jgi:hypothetical protein
MISNLIRKLTSLLSIFFKNNHINSRKDYKILHEIKILLKNHNINYSNLKKTHKIFNQKSYLLLKKNNLKNFLRNGFIQKMFFIHNRLFIYNELNILKQSKDWQFYKTLIKEDSIGNPIRFFLYPQSSGNRINHVFHLSILKNELGINLKQIKNIFEFGAGYGCMARIFSKINKNIKYLCFDTYYINLLQYYYLKHNNLNVGFNRKKNNFLLESNLNKIYPINKKKYLFIANWSLSETPINFRKKFEKLIDNSQYILICFQEKFEDIDNLKYFNLLKKKKSYKFEIKIIKNKFYKGNLINKQNHYFFIGNKR